MYKHNKQYISKMLINSIQYINRMPAELYLSRCERGKKKKKKKKKRI